MGTEKYEVLPVGTVCNLVDDILEELASSICKMETEGSSKISIIVYYQIIWHDIPEINNLE
jgi:hypothetical protein